jgi:hypothetical protein
LARDDFTRVCSHNHQLDQIDEPDLDEFSEVMRDFFDPADRSDTETMIAAAAFVSNSLAEASFLHPVWEFLLHSDIIRSLATGLGSKGPPNLLMAMLNCLSNILFYPPDDELKQIQERYGPNDIIPPPP